MNLIGIGIANEEHLEAVAKNDPSVIPLVDASLHNLCVFLSHSHFLLLRPLSTLTHNTSHSALRRGCGFVLFLRLEIRIENIGRRLHQKIEKSRRLCFFFSIVFFSESHFSCYFVSGLYGALLLRCSFILYPLCIVGVSTLKSCRA